MIHIEVTGPTAGNGWWKELAGLYLGETAGQEFSIHCWKDEEDCIQKALDYGAVQPSNWAYGTQVAGGVTAEFGDFLLSSAQYQKQGPDFGEQMTPFFGVFLGGVFSSSHYGRELDVAELEGERGRALKELLEQLKQEDWLNICEYRELNEMKQSPPAMPAGSVSARRSGSGGGEAQVVLRP